MKRKTRNKIIVISIILFILIASYFAFIQQQIFSDSTFSGDLAIKSSRGTDAFVEGDTIQLDYSKANANSDCQYYGNCYGLQGYLIFQNNKLLYESGRGSNGVHYSQCPEPFGNMYNAYNWCSTWQYTYRELFQCSASEPKTNAPQWQNCKNIILSQNFPNGKLEAGNNQEIEVVAFLTRNDNKYRAVQRFKINVAPLPCVFDSNQLLAVQDFRSGSVISKDTLRFKDDFVKTCSAHPPIVVDSFTRTSYTDLTILTKLNNNQPYTVPNDKVVALFYVVDSNSDIPTQCSPDKVYNIEEQTCQDVVGFVTVCNEGTLQDGVCVTQANVEYTCPEGFRLDLSQNITQGLCIPRTQELCNDENAKLLEENGIKKCVIYPKTEYSCADGFSFDKEKGKCVKEGGYETPGVFNYKLIYYILSSMVVVSLIFYMFRKGRKK